MRLSSAGGCPHSSRLHFGVSRQVHTLPETANPGRAPEIRFRRLRPGNRASAPPGTRAAARDGTPRFSYGPSVLAITSHSASGALTLCGYCPSCERAATFRSCKRALRAGSRSGLCLGLGMSPVTVNRLLDGTCGPTRGFGGVFVKPPPGGNREVGHWLLGRLCGRAKRVGSSGRTGAPVRQDGSTRDLSSCRTGESRPPPEAALAGRQGVGAIATSRQHTWASEPAHLAHDKHVRLACALLLLASAVVLGVFSAIDWGTQEMFVSVAAYV